MRLTHPEMQSVIEFLPEKVSSIVIENRRFFREFVEDIYKQVNGHTGKLVLSEGLKILDIHKAIELTDSFVSFTINRKTLQSKILSAMELEATNETMFLKTAELLLNMENYLEELSDEFKCDIVCSKLNISAILKMAGIYIRDEYDDPLERIVDYMEIMREFDKEKLFVFVNMRSYFPDDDIKRFFLTVISNEYKVFLIDSFASTCLASENRLTVDDDLCEF